MSLLIILAVAFAGCDIIGIESDSEKVDQTLEPGGTASTESGMQLMASNNSINESITVTGQEIEDPIVGTPLPEVVNLSGSFHKITSSSNIDLSAEDTPLYLALPVPEDADPTQLALGVRVPSSFVTDTDASSPEYGWDLLQSAYEPESDQLVVPVRFLVSDGIVLSVIETDDYSSPSMADAEGENLFERTKDFFGQETMNTKALPHSGGFNVKCKGGFNSGECGSREKNLVESYLKDAHDDFVSDFRSPDLRSPVLSNAYTWIIKKEGTAWCKGDTAGKYLSLTNKAITCYDGNNAPSEGTTRHEFFHAIQYNYAPISWSKLPKQRPNWVIEATAELTEDANTSGSKAAIRASQPPLRTVDIPLTSNNDRRPYRTQDFWTYLINNRSSTLADILEPVFDQQSNGTNKPTAKKVDELYSMTDDYWGWVRNQAVESRVTTGFKSKLNAVCDFDSDVLARPTTVTYDAGTRSESDPKEESSVVSRLSTNVMAIEVQTGSNRIDLEISASTPDNKTFIRVYQPYDSPTTDCWDRSQNASHSIDDMMVESSNQTYYVMATASMIDNQRSVFTVNISHEDRITK
ncbi:hypothetical protein [Rhodohalobacter sulfatireducens]|uniref:hypothetical protein n=1 Tax=Rhodohalobacter sulfatireducens TaxID=2911366 RepID=UPI001EDAFB6F|nr:hypothetical protein [Rhodohalobacter sulfatireducens]